MTDESKLGEAIHRGYQAEIELQRTAEAFATMKADYLKAWEATPLRDTEGRERFWQAVQIVGIVQNHLASVMANGRVAERDLKHLRTGKKPIF